MHQNTYPMHLMLVGSLVDLIVWGQHLCPVRISTRIKQFFIQTQRPVLFPVVQRDLLVDVVLGFAGRDVASHAKTCNSVF